MTTYKKNDGLLRQQQWIHHKQKEDENDMVDPFDNEKTFYNCKGEWGHIQQRTSRSILKDLKPFDIPENIKFRADVIYNKMHYHVRRKKIRYQMLFYCVYCAYLELNQNVDPTELGVLFGLKQGDVQRCDSLFSPLQTGYTPPVKHARPTKYLDQYCEKIGLDNDAGLQIKKLSEALMIKDPEFLQENPQTVAAGILKYFVITNGIILEDPDIIRTVTKRSNATIDAIFQRIITIDNK
jgi:hypothetical protein